MKKLLLTLTLSVLALAAQAQWANNPENVNKNRFRQLEQELPTPGPYRTASGAPGSQYWQQRADYVIDAELDDTKQHITGKETITYTNNSPDVLSYLWLQLDQNKLLPNSNAVLTETGTLQDRVNFRTMQVMAAQDTFDGSFHIGYVKDAAGKDLKYTIVGTMMRIDLPVALQPKLKYTFSISWDYYMNDRMVLGERGGFEFFAEDGNYLYTVTQWFPRMCVYSDYLGWVHKEFLGRGEFTLPFGNFRVRMTVPADHVVGATGTLQNPTQVLTATQQERWKQAVASTKEPVVIVTQAEATEAEKSKATAKKTWEYYAENVRDFAWTSSRKFIWDAMAVNIGGKSIMAMSYYGKEANPLWGVYSTKVVAHTLRSYSAHTIDYPYPVAISVEAANGMEYPMICFNNGRPEKDGTYSERVKYGMIGVIIHEVGHNFFPMIVNSDERNDTWMDEGLNSFCEGMAELEWEKNYPTRRMYPKDIVEYMKGDKTTQVPIMSQSESVLQFGNNAYGKPAIALNVLRETVLGRELFDYAFKEYARRWAFKHPAPADFFRTMEDASGKDLDWFWRGWFFTTDHTDISIENVIHYQPNSQNPDTEKGIARANREATPKHPSATFNQASETAVDRDPVLSDFYNRYDPLQVQPWDKAAYDKYLASLTYEERRLLNAGKHFYQIDLKNIGGLVMPVLLTLKYADGTTEEMRIPAEIWRYNNEKISKVLMLDKELASIELDARQETADADLSNNSFPPREVKNRFELFKQNRPAQPNLMQLDRQFNGGGSQSPAPGSNR